MPIRIAPLTLSIYFFSTLLIIIIIISQTPPALQNNDDDPTIANTTTSAMTVLQITPFFHKATSTLTYVVFDGTTKDAVVIDTVQDYDPETKTTSSEHADLVMKYINDKELNLHWILDTHPHADHLTGAKLFKAKFPNAQVGIGEGVLLVQSTFKDILAMGDDFAVDGSQFDKLFKDGEEVEVGSFSFKVIFTPGHTPACACYHIHDNLFTGDSIFMPDFGTGRCDFPNGDAVKLYHSIQKIYALPDETRIFVGHDYSPAGRALWFQTTVGEEKAFNKHVKADTTEAEFVEFRTTRDAQLNEPRLLKPSINANIQGGLQ